MKSIVGQYGTLVCNSEGFIVGQYGTLVCNSEGFIIGQYGTLVYNCVNCLTKKKPSDQRRVNS